MPVLRTARLLLRPWRPSDHEPFARLNADPDVMRHFPAPLSRAQSDAMADRIRALMDERGWGMWAVEVPGVAPFIGFVGLHVPSAELPFFPCVEIGWRLDKPHWGNGYATEAAARVLRFGFTRLMLDEIVSFTAVSNAPSLAVMARAPRPAQGKPPAPAHPAPAVAPRLAATPSRRPDRGRTRLPAPLDHSIVLPWRGFVRKAVRSCSHE